MVAAMASADPCDKVRLDKWLWAARFFKTRSQAAQAISGGHVHVEGKRAKPARTVSIGETLAVTKGRMVWTVIVQRISDRRGPATQAATLYEETTASKEARARSSSDHGEIGSGMQAGAGRPTKRDRRRLEHLKRRR